MPSASVGTVAFDVIGTLFSLDAVRAALRAEGAPDHALQMWFPAALRDYFALSHSGDYRPLREVLAADLAATTVLDGDARARVLAAFGTLDPAPGAIAACDALSGAGWRLLTLTNSSEDATRGLLERAGLAGRFHAVLSCDSIETGKPHADVYALARAEAVGDLWMIASHVWDLGGAARAGLKTAWVRPDGTPWPPYHPAPDVEALDLETLAERILASA